MKYLIANDATALTSMGSVDQTHMFSQNRILGYQSVNDTAAFLNIQGSLNPNTEDHLTFRYANAEAPATFKESRLLIDELVGAINSDSKTGFTVLFDRTNDVYLRNQDPTGDNQVVEQD